MAMGLTEAPPAGNEHGITKLRPAPDADEETSPMVINGITLDRDTVYKVGGAFCAPRNLRL